MHWEKIFIWHAELERSLRHNFHWFELYLGILVAIVLMATAALLIWEVHQKKHQRDRWRTRDNLEANVDGKVLARLLGDVSPAGYLVHDLQNLTDMVISGTCGRMVIRSWP